MRSLVWNMELLDFQFPPTKSFLRAMIDEGMICEVFISFLFIFMSFEIKYNKDPPPQMFVLKINLVRHFEMRSSLFHRIYSQISTQEFHIANHITQFQANLSWKALYFGYCTFSSKMEVAIKESTRKPMHSSYHCIWLTFFIDCVVFFEKE